MARENIAVKVGRVPLVFGFGEHFSHGHQYIKALVTNHQLAPTQATPVQLFE